MNTLDAWLTTIIGSQEQIEWWQMLIRATFAFFVAILSVRLGGKRIFGKNSAFDIVMAVILGSIISRAITGNAPFFPTLLAGILLVFLHRFLAWIAVNNGNFGDYIKGEKTVLIREGEILWDNLKRKQLTQGDLEEQLRLSGKSSLKQIHTAYLERNGKISFLTEED